MIKVNQIINNTNGYQYKVIAHFGSYTLVERMGEYGKEYIVAYKLEQYSKGWSWGNGHYFSILENAKECFKNKTLFTVEEAIAYMENI